MQQSKNQSSSNPCSRRWLITDNTIAPDVNTERYQDKFNDNVKYACWQKEKAATGKVHMQAYLKLLKPVKLTGLKTMLGNVHAEIARGNDEQCITYCSKAETRLEGPFTVGECDKQGTRRDLEDVANDLLEGKRSEDIALTRTAVFIKYYRGIQAAEAAIQRKRSKPWRDVNVQVYWGDSGTGKTRTCYELHPDLYRVHTSGAVWFDGYSGQEAILFDDFYGQVPFAYMLQLLDGYAIQVPIKGGFVSAQWNTIYITSNSPPEFWWGGESSKVPEKCRAAFRRRIRDVHELSDGGTPGMILPRSYQVPSQESDSAESVSE